MFPPPVIIPSVILLATLAEAQLITKTFDSSGIRRMQLKNPGGAVRIQVAEGTESSVEVQRSSRGEDCVLKVEKRGKTLVIATESPFVYFQPRCSINFNIKIPRDIALNIRNGDGPITVMGTRGPVEFSSTSGAVTINGEITELKGRSGNGSVQVVGLSGSGHLKVGSGDISLTYKSVPQRGRLSIRSDAGNATVFVPHDSRLRAQLSARKGRLSNELRNSRGSIFTIAAKSGKGNLAIRRVYSEKGG